MHPCWYVSFNRYRSLLTFFVATQCDARISGYDTRVNTSLIHISFHSYSSLLMFLVATQRDVCISGYDQRVNVPFLLYTRLFFHICRTRLLFNMHLLYTSLFIKSDVSLHLVLWYVSVHVVIESFLPWRFFIHVSFQIRLFSTRLFSYVHVQSLLAYVLV